MKTGRRLGIGMLILGTALVAIAAISPYLSEWRVVYNETTPTSGIIASPGAKDGFYQVSLVLDESDCASPANGYIIMGYLRWLSPDGITHGREIDGCGDLSYITVPISVKAGTSIVFDPTATQNSSPYVLRVGVFGFWG